jgi:hypothetical protein
MCFFIAKVIHNDRRADQLHHEICVHIAPKTASRFCERPYISIHPIDMKTFISKFLVVFLFITSLSGCTLDPVKETTTHVKETPNFYREINEKLSLTGKVVYVSVYDEGDIGKVLNQNHIQEFAKSLKDYLVKKGFTVTDKYSKGYSALYIAGDEYRPGDKNSKVTETTSETTFVDGKVVSNSQTVSTDHPLNRITIQWDINAYGKRPAKWFSLTYTSTKSLDDTFSDVTKTFFVNLDSVLLASPPENTKMAGEPGCIPRFGYDERVVVEDGREIFKVTKVPVGSPAQKAGLHVGDIMDAIDSVPYTREWQTKPPKDVYEKRVSVPIKFTRNGETIRSQIQAKIMCE